MTPKSPTSPDTTDNERQESDIQDDEEDPLPPVEVEAFVSPQVQITHHRMTFRPRRGLKKFSKSSIGEWLLVVSIEFMLTFWEKKRFNMCFTVFIPENKVLWLLFVSIVRFS